MAKNLPTGEMLLVGFYGPEVPKWLKDFSKEYGLGGVILFDYYCQTKEYKNNVYSPAQVKQLCKDLHNLPSRPMVFVDQEGGKVRRLKDKFGFSFVPSQLAINRLPQEERVSLWEGTYKELADLGIDYNLAPVIDLNFNPANPDIGAVERSFGVNAAEIRENVVAINKIAGKHGIKLCLKHYPGLGAAKVNSHLELTDLSGTITSEQLALFDDLLPALNGQTVLISHGMVNEWDSEYPVSISKKGLASLRAKHPEAVFISDDLQMQGLQLLYSTSEAVPLGIAAGIDLCCIGNNLLNQEHLISGIAAHLQKMAGQDEAFRGQCIRAIANVQKAKIS